MIRRSQRVSGQSAPRGNVCRSAGIERRHLQQLTPLNPVDLAFEPYDENAAAVFSCFPPSRDLECAFLGRLGAPRSHGLLMCCHEEHVTGCRGGE